jgi:hypothetical protein
VPVAARICRSRRQRLQQIGSMLDWLLAKAFGTGAPAREDFQSSMFSERKEQKRPVRFSQTGRFELN